MLPTVSGPSVRILFLRNVLKFTSWPNRSPSLLFRFFWNRFLVFSMIFSMSLIPTWDVRTNIRKKIVGYHSRMTPNPAINIMIIGHTSTPNCKTSWLMQITSSTISCSTLAPSVLLVPSVVLSEPVLLAGDTTALLRLVISMYSLVNCLEVAACASTESFCICPVCIKTDLSFSSNKSFSEQFSTSLSHMSGMTENAKILCEPADRRPSEPSTVPTPRKIERAFAEWSSSA